MRNKNIGIIVQARTGSTRLPGKILLPIDDSASSFLDLLLSRLTCELPHLPIVVATSLSSKDDVIEEHARMHQLPAFRGSEEDVLDRFISCAEHFGFEIIVRICSDNPFLDIGALSDLIARYQSEDYLSYKINGLPSILTHFGFFAEIVTLQALKKAGTKGPGCHEHVTNCIYQDPNEFNVGFVPIEIPNSGIRCTLDTAGDFESLTFIFKEWYSKRTDTTCPYKTLISFIENHSHLIEEMQNQIEINNK